MSINSANRIYNLNTEVSSSISITLLINKMLIISLQILKLGPHGCFALLTDITHLLRRTALDFPNKGIEEFIPPHFEL